LKITSFVLIAPLVTAVFMSSVGAMPSYLLVLCLLFLAALGTATFHPWAASLAGGLSAGLRWTILALPLAAVISLGTKEA